MTVFERWRMELREAAMTAEKLQVLKHLRPEVVALANRVIYLEKEAEPILLGSCLIEGEADVSGDGRGAEM